MVIYPNPHPTVKRPNITIIRSSNITEFSHNIWLNDTSTVLRLRLPKNQYDLVLIRGLITQERYMRLDILTNGKPKYASSTAREWPPRFTSILNAVLVLYGQDMIGL